MGKCCVSLDGSYGYAFGKAMESYHGNPIVAFLQLKDKGFYTKTDQLDVEVVVDDKIKYAYDEMNIQEIEMQEYPLNEEGCQSFVNDL